MAPVFSAEAPSAAEIAEIAEATRAAFPAPFAELAKDVRLTVLDWPPEDVLDEMEIDSAYELTGLYEGAALTQRSVEWPEPPSSIFLYRRPILDEWVDRGNVSLRALVSHLTVHEFAHHFGWSDDDIAAIDRWWE